MATLADVVVTLTAHDCVTPLLRHIRWNLMTLDGHWHGEQMVGDRGPRPIYVKHAVARKNPLYKSHL